MVYIKSMLGQPALWLLGWMVLLGQFVNPTAVAQSPSLYSRQANFYPIGGIPKVVERRSITVLQSQYPDIFNMLILAWANVAARQENLDLSYYQVAGIHGYPYIPWQYPPSATVNPRLGYCTHRSVLFLSWHRPYVLLFEQLLHEEAVSIARKFSGADGTKYRNAADLVRLPYWDWASKGTESRIPDVLKQQSITVKKPGPNGTAVSTSIPNPLFAYKFLNPQPGTSGLGPQTLRSPDANSVDFGGSTRDATFNTFQNALYNDYQRNAEGVHNGVHVDVGGDMQRLATSAFDPIFWLHHCNVDRLYAMYQATHPTTSLTPEKRSPTFALGGPGNDDIRTPLYPFRNPNRVEWTSDQVKTVQSIFTYGYSYPEVPQGQSGTALQQFTSQKINELYGPSIPQSGLQNARVGTPNTPNARREWEINIIVSPADVPGSVRILFFLGSDPKPVARAGIFADDNRNVAGDRVFNFAVPLTSALLDQNVALRAEDTVPKLTEQLRWRIERADNGAEIRPSEIPSLLISVTSSVVTFSPSGNVLPSVSNVLTHIKPTVGKPAGLQLGSPAPVGNKAPASLDENLPGSPSSFGSFTLLNGTLS